jgi:hypothetical protein
MIDTERVAKLEAQVEGIKDNVAELKDDVKEIHSRITTGNREILEKIDAMECRLDTKMIESAKAAKIQHEEIQKEIQKDVFKITDRVDILERWRWMIVGGAIVLGYVLGHLELITKIFH